jgi:predicted permease
MRELRLAARTLLRQPTFTLAVVLTLGLAMGVTTGFFGVIDALLLRPLPGVEATSLAIVHVTRNGELDGFSGFSAPTFRDFREGARTLDGLESFVGRGFALGDETATGVVGGQLVSGGFFGLLGTRAHRGRLIGPQDDAPGAPPVVVITQALWQQRFGGRSDVLGKPIRVNGRPFTLVGIAEPGFRGHFVGFPLDVYVPLHAAPLVAADVDLEDRADGSLELVARLGSGTSLSAAQKELVSIATRVAHDFPDSHRGWSVALRRYTGLDADLRGSVIGFVAVLAAVGALVLLVACVNVGGLVLARGASRERDLAVRAALGASRGALVRPLLVETLLLFALGGLLGGALTGPAAAALHAFLPEFAIPLHLDVTPDWRVALFALVATLVTGLAFGLAPAVASSRVDLVQVLKLGGRSVAAVPQRARRAFVTAQIALCLVLLVGAGLFLRELQRARALEPGFRVAGVGLVNVDASLLDRSPAVARELFLTWLARVRSRAEVQAASLARTVPLGFGKPTTHVLVDGLEPPTPEGFGVGWNAVAPGYFETLGIPLLSGRDFAAGDAAGAEPVALVSRATAARLFPGQEPLGRHLRCFGKALRIVGVVGDIAVDRSGRRDGLFVYVPFTQVEERAMSLVLRTRGPLPLDEVRQELQALDPDVPVLSAMSLARHAGAALFPQRMAASVTSAFAAFALVLASVGLYGIVAYLVERRRHELAVRAALGARAADLRRLVLLSGLRPVAAGLAAGFVGALLLGQLAAGFVPSVGAFDPVVFAGGAVLLAAVSLFAADFPARRAARARPMDLLRGE